MGADEDIPGSMPEPQPTIAAATRTMRMSGIYSCPPKVNPPRARSGPVFNAVIFDHDVRPIDRHAGLRDIAVHRSTPARDRRHGVHLPRERCHARRGRKIFRAPSVDPVPVGLARAECRCGWSAPVFRGQMMDWFWFGLNANLTRGVREKTSLQKNCTEARFLL
jgi:hypothetical protein